MGAKRFDAFMSLLQAADVVNTLAPGRFATYISDIMNQAGCPLRGSRVFFVGLGPDSATGLCGLGEVIGAFIRRGATVHYYDPRFPVITTKGPNGDFEIESQPFDADTQDVVLVMNVLDCDPEMISGAGGIIVDACNGLAAVRGKRDHIHLI